VSAAAVIAVMPASTASASSPDYPSMTCSSSTYLELPTYPAIGGTVVFAYRVNQSAWQYSPYYYVNRAGSFRWTGSAWVPLGVYSFNPRHWSVIRPGDVVHGWAFFYRADGQQFSYALGSCREGGTIVPIGSQSWSITAP
jgi:hypothetical protein